MSLYHQFWKKIFGLIFRDLIQLLGYSLQLQNVAKDFTGKEAMYLIQLKYSYAYSRTAQPPKVLLVSRPLSNSFLPRPSIDIWLLSLPKNSTCKSLAKLLHRAFNPESVQYLELHSIVCYFLFCYQNEENFVLLVSCLALWSFALTNPDCHNSHQSLYYTCWENEKEIPTPTFSFYKDLNILFPCLQIMYFKVRSPPCLLTSCHVSSIFVDYYFTDIFKELELHE